MSQEQRTISKFPGLATLIPILILIMEISWIYAWAVWISLWPTWGWNGPPFTFLSCLILAILTEIVTRYSLSHRWSLKRVRLFVVPSTILLLALLIRWNLGDGYSLGDSGWFTYIGSHLSSLVFSAILGVYVIWRGIANGTSQISFRNAYTKFIIGLVGIIFVLIVWGISSRQTSVWPGIGVYIILFFGLGLLSMALANLEALKAELAKHQEGTSSFTRRWVSMLLALIVGILGLSLAFASIFSTNIAGTIIHGVSVFGDWLLIAISYIILPLAYIVEGIIYLVRLLIAWLVGTPQPVKMTIPDLSDLQKAAEGQPTAQIPSWILLSLKWGFLAIVIAVVIFFLVRALVRYWEGKPEKEIEELNETLWSYNAFKTDLRSILSWLFSKFRLRRARSEASLPPEAVRAGKESIKQFSIRELYQALLWEGQETGTVRSRAETPYEYRQKLSSQLVQGKEEINAITEAYVSSRYGELAPPPEELTILNRLWHRLKAKITNEESNPDA